MKCRGFRFAALFFVPEKIIVVFLQEYSNL